MEYLFGVGISAPEAFLNSLHPHLSMDVISNICQRPYSAWWMMCQGRVWLLCWILEGAVPGSAQWDVWVSRTACPAVQGSPTQWGPLYCFSAGYTQISIFIYTIYVFYSSPVVTIFSGWGFTHKILPGSSMFAGKEDISAFKSLLAWKSISILNHCISYSKFVTKAHICAWNASWPT